MSYYDEKGDTMEKNRVTLKIYGNSYTILTEDDPEYVEQLGELINKEMHDVSNDSPSLSQLNVRCLWLLTRQTLAKRQTARRLTFVFKSRII